MTQIPEKPSLDGLEIKWDGRWDLDATYRFDRTAHREQVFSVDTPPPTISGSLHLGTAFGYIQADSIVRFHRMLGKEVFYPMGWDDNGLPTERRVQKHFGVRCDPTLPYDPDLQLAQAASGASERPVSRPNFVELCHRLTQEFERDFEQQWRRMGLSVDWSLSYATIDERSRRAAQRAFLRNLARGEAYASEAPTLWDVDFQTAVAQAEFEDRQVPGAYHRLRFTEIGTGTAVEVETTRPELLPSCVALVAHPDDERYQPLFGTQVRSPLFGVSVPVLGHRLADPDKGSGIAMVCTFGDQNDIVWWREFDLPTRTVLRRDGRFQPERPEWIPAAAAGTWDQLGGRTVRQARRAVVESLTASGELIGEIRPIVHDVKFYEKGERPLEIVSSRQWYIRNGARDSALQTIMLDRGRELDWHPDFMRVRYEHWVEGLSTDWLISRQRYFGVPFPIWYRTDADGETDRSQPLLAREQDLPVDPTTDVPPGYQEGQRDRPDGFRADPDVMDTWATSSLTPQIAGRWADDDDLFHRVFPHDLRPQGPEIIRTWLFSTVLRAQLEHGVLPWRNTTINGWILDPDRKKMSKSTGNVLTPMPLVDRWGADALRYWSCRSAPGADATPDEGQLRVGRRLALKILNATRFVLMLGATAEATPAQVTEPLDRAMLVQLSTVVDICTGSLEAYEHHRALDAAEAFFWRFCDDYIELVKGRGYGKGGGAASVQAALSVALSVQLRLFAPFLPFVAEEAWSWWQPGSVHRAAWPTGTATSAGEERPRIFDAVVEVLTDVRKAKSEAHRSQRTEVTRLVVHDRAAVLADLRAAREDLDNAGRVRHLDLVESEVRRIVVELADPDPEPIAVGSGPADSVGATS